MVCVKPVERLSDSDRNRYITLNKLEELMKKVDQMCYGKEQREEKNWIPLKMAWRVLSGSARWAGDNDAWITIH